MSHNPPGFSSRRWTIVFTFGPYQRANSSGSVQDFHTSSRGASNTRSSTYVGTSRISAPFRFSPFQLFQQAIELIEARRPELFELFKPTHRRRHRLSPEPRGPSLSVDMPLDQPRPFQHSQMFRHRRLAQLK